MGKDITWLEYSGRANGAAYSLGEQELVVLVGYRCHHQTEDMEKCPSNNQVSSTKCVVQLPNNGALGDR